MFDLTRAEADAIGGTFRSSVDRGEFKVDGDVRGDEDVPTQQGDVGPDLIIRTTRTEEMRRGRKPREDVDATVDVAQTRDIAAMIGDGSFAMLHSFSDISGTAGHGTTADRADVAGFAGPEGGLNRAE